MTQRSDGFAVIYWVTWATGIMHAWRKYNDVDALLCEIRIFTRISTSCGDARHSPHVIAMGRPACSVASKFIQLFRSVLRRACLYTDSCRNYRGNIKQDISIRLAGERMNMCLGVIGAILCVLALGRTMLVLDGVLDFHGNGSSVHRFLSCFRGTATASGHEQLEGEPVARRSRRSGSESPRKFRWVYIPWPVCRHKMDAKILHNTPASWVGPLIR